MLRQITANQKMLDGSQTTSSNNPVAKQSYGANLYTLFVLI